MNAEEVARGLESLAAAFPNDPTLQSPQTVAAYADRLKWLHPEDFSEALRHVVDTCQFFPKISEIREAAESAAARRIEKKDHDRRLLTAPKEVIHEQHQRFRDLLEGKVELPEPRWWNDPQWVAKRKKEATR